MPVTRSDRSFQQPDDPKGLLLWAKGQKDQRANAPKMPSLLFFGELSVVEAFVTVYLTGSSVSSCRHGYLCQPSIDNVTIVSHNSAKEIPKAAASCGNKLVGVIPGKLLASIQ